LTIALELSLLLPLFPILAVETIPVLFVLLFSAVSVVLNLEATGTIEDVEDSLGCIEATAVTVSVIERLEDLDIELHCSSIVSSVAKAPLSNPLISGLFSSLASSLSTL